MRLCVLCVGRSVADAAVQITMALILADNIRVESLDVVLALPLQNQLQGEERSALDLLLQPLYCLLKPTLQLNANRNDRQKVRIMPHAMTAL